jgi:glycine/D-amino acid oxidase-like deaminating enzyme
VTSIKVLPRDTSPTGWNRILPRRVPTSALRGNTSFDWLVIGAGFTGLAAARRLAENRPGERIALLEAQEIGEGTSGRNTGIAVDVPYNSGSPLSELEGRRRHVRLNRAALDYLEALIQVQGIDCQWSKRGKYHAAITERGRVADIEPVARELEALGEPFRRFNRSELAAAIGTEYFAAAIHTPGGVLLNPAALVRGLADALPPNVSLYENSPVVDFEHRGGIRIKTPQASLAAGNVILATNGFVREFGFFRGRLLMFAIYASLTRPLPAAELEKLGRDRDWGLTPANVFGGSAMRFTQDGRFVLRAGVLHAPSFSRSDVSLTNVARLHQARLRARFPTIAADIEHTWVGYDSMSTDRSHGFGHLAPHVFAAVCQNGIGITKGTISGLLAADLACGRDNPLIADLEGLGAPPRLPPRPFLDLGLLVRFGWDAWRNSHERQ